MTIVEVVEVEVAVDVGAVLELSWRYHGVENKFLKNMPCILIKIKEAYYRA